MKVEAHTYDRKVSFNVCWSFKKYLRDRKPHFSEYVGYCLNLYSRLLIRVMSGRRKRKDEAKQMVLVVVTTAVTECAPSIVFVFRKEKCF